MPPRLRVSLPSSVKPVNQFKKKKKSETAPEVGVTADSKCSKLTVNMNHNPTTRHCLARPQQIAFIHLPQKSSSIPRPSGHSSLRNSAKHNPAACPEQVTALSAHAPLPAFVCYSICIDSQLPVPTFVQQNFSVLKSLICAFIWSGNLTKAKIYKLPMLSYYNLDVDGDSFKSRLGAQWDF